ncbi:Lon protease family protein [Pseudomaricurvus sp. HS19]|uniref:Lon protease family protein n=1 Tax=Pseudomaricurvus sp. HS19 TaxID=2692626 RepID=UPI00136B80B8|nr:ATP-binding protein [Pseudomaricurvus sp. HS19]MYM63364.1 AAA family ATPase [Pseudomaricurvus sp. HS19]
MITQLSAGQLYNSCDPQGFGFTLSSELEPLDIPLGQERALEAIEFGVEITREGFNLFVLGAPGLGKHELVKQILSRQEQPRTELFDWCYVNNFDDPQRPQLLRLPVGMGQELRNDMQQLVEDLLTAIPAAFQSDDYQRRREEIRSRSHEHYESDFRALADEAQESGVAMMRTPSGYTMAPMADDKVLTAEEFEALPEEQQKAIEKKIEEMQKKLQAHVREMPLIRREVSRQLKKLNQEITQLTVEQFIDSIEKRYEQQDNVLAYLAAVQKNATENASDFLPDGEGSDDEQVENRAQGFHRYQVNLLVDNTRQQTAPIITEDNPTYQNLVGRIEHVSHMGTLVTDFTLIKPGALHRANGGYLILDAQKVLTHMYAWEGLKRSLKSRQVTISSLEEVLSLVSTISLEPEAMPIDVKVILTGERLLYYLLKRYDNEFSKLFKVVADFAHSTDRSTGSQLLYARMIATRQQHEELLPLTSDAVARIIEAASRQSDDSTKLSLQVDFVSDVLKEADYWAGKAGSVSITLEHVEQALEKRRYRHDRIRELYHEQITRGISMIATRGSAVAQVNGLTVIALADQAFGSPSRITATARLGSGKVIDIEREAKLGGEIHSKGVMILSAYLANRFARDRPLPLAATLVFEQSYGGVDGDSATAAELCALLSAIGEIPLAQNLAVTGSMNQHGQIQAIGGVNEKIEGFFDICQAAGLSGDQGVIIPASNQVHLMLRHDVREAVSAGQFHIYTAEQVDDVMGALSGLAPGAVDADGNYPPDSINGRISARIEAWQQLQKKFARRDTDEGDGADKPAPDHDRGNKDE